MISLKEALEIFKEKHPILTVTAAYLYDNKYFMFVAVRDTNEVNINSPYYLVDVKGTIYNITPTMNIDAFNDALENHKLDIRRLQNERTAPEQ